MSGSMCKKSKSIALGAPSSTFDNIVDNINGHSILRLVATTTEKANGGDPQAMLDLSNWYYHGEHGLPISLEVAYHWTKRAAMMDYPTAMADQGYMLYNGQGTKANPAEASCLLADAASLGSRKAAAYLGALYFLGKEQGGYPRCYSRAKYWLERSLGNIQEHASSGEDFDVAKAEQLLGNVEDALKKLQQSGRPVECTYH